jgi:putative endonuclease
MLDEASYITCVTKSAKRPPVLKKRVLSPKQNKQRHFVAGAKGEQLARDFLVKKNYQILAENLLFKTYEIDLIALDKQYQELVFVEVKTRRTAYFGSPSQTVDHRKIKAMHKAARAYLYRKGLRNNYRFDIITVTSGKIAHYQNVTWP